jgi:hypothetical protein
MRKKAHGKLSGDFPHALRMPVQGGNDFPTGHFPLQVEERAGLLLKELSDRGKTMSDPITQMRLSMRLERYLSDYTEKNVRKETRSTEEWDTVWHVANVARRDNHLTPELVDDVRRALHKLLA